MWGFQRVPESSRGFEAVGDTTWAFFLGFDPTQLVSPKLLENHSTASQKETTLCMWHQILEILESCWQLLTPVILPSWEGFPRKHTGGCARELVGYSQIVYLILPGTFLGAEGYWRNALHLGIHGDAFKQFWRTVQRKSVARFAASTPLCMDLLQFESKAEWT